MQQITTPKTKEKRLTWFTIHIFLFSFLGFENMILSESISTRTMYTCSITILVNVLRKSCPYNVIFSPLAAPVRGRMEKVNQKAQIF